MQNKSGQFQKRIAFLCTPGLESFLKNITNELERWYEVDRCYSQVLAEHHTAIEVADIVWIEWCNELAINLTTNPSVLKNKKQVIIRLHSYEALAEFHHSVNWNNVTDLVFVADHIKNIVLNQITLPETVKVHVIPNGIDLDKFEFKERQKGFNLAYLGDINFKKGPMLLFHAFHKLWNSNNKYRLHIAGNFQDARYEMYLDQFKNITGMETSTTNYAIQYYGHVDNPYEWLQDKNYIINSSVLEGHPVGLMEAMAMGIKPLIHSFVGAFGLYPKEWIWRTIPELSTMVKSKDYNSKKYRDYLIKKQWTLEDQVNSIRNIIDPNSVIKEKEKMQLINLGKMTSLKQPKIDTVDNKVGMALAWIKKNTIDGKGIAVTNQSNLAYPEVTGYLIPTLWNWGEQDLARSYSQWLFSQQLDDGSFPAPGGNVGIAFDTAQIIKGWTFLLDKGFKGLEDSIRRAVDWIIKTTKEGKIEVPGGTMWQGARGSIPELVHLYCLQPIHEAGKKLNENNYVEFVEKCWEYYKTLDWLLLWRQPGMLSHFFFYIQESLIYIKENFPDPIDVNMSNFVDQYIVPAYYDTKWTCTTGQAQAAVVLAKLGESEKAQKYIEYLEMFQNSSGGFFGSHGLGANYFQDREPSWAVKFYLDAKFLLSPKNSTN